MDKTMEKEYKWRADEKLLGQALLWASSRIGSQSRTINMESSYFGTADGLLKEHQAALRLRRENDRSVCCMKLRNTDTPDGMRAHEEYQCEAVSLPTACAVCPSLVHRTTCASGRWQPTCREICTVSFRRCAVLLQEGDTVCEMALDEGELRHNGKSAPLCEIELEYVAGSEDTFHALAAELAQQLDLVVEPTSKLARAMAL